MDISKLPPGRNPPDEINVLIEVPLRSDPIKYEFDKDNGCIFVDRYLYTTMFYPCNYGFIPNTLSQDGDPVDVMVVGRMPVVPGAILRSRPIGVLKMEDEAGLDEKILAVPIDKITQVTATRTATATFRKSTCAASPTSSSTTRTSSPTSGSRCWAGPTRTRPGRSSWRASSAWPPRPRAEPGAALIRACRDQPDF